MIEQDWFVNDEGQVQSWPDRSLPNKRAQTYRLYRFLTEVEDILAMTDQDQERLQAIYPLVRELLTDSAWLQYEVQPPDPEQGWSVTMLYDEPNFPLTVQTVVWLPGQTSRVHNHAAWGVVALVSGQEKNTFWQRTPSTDHPHKIAEMGELILNPGDTISLMPEAIHCVEALGDEPTVTFNLYGLSDYQARYDFDPVAHTAKLF
ncbi:cupin [Acaryochloris sp. IP29b_bin.148]|uniref:cysteine dioxygenase family protein n=1 Tax=Acaryochloris sp. IP29b_bin.148 TaxID=2969218 RepID=UPI0026320AD6|nr:cupin [Acaryochloris sp. IP29b_bin.148]